MFQDPQIVIARGVLAPVAGEGTQAAPTSGQTITIFDSTLTAGLPGIKSPSATRLRRLILSILSSHASAAGGVGVFGSVDGVNWDFQDTVADVAANVAYQLDILVRTPHVKVTYTNSAATLTSWRMALLGDMSQRSIGK